MQQQQQQQQAAAAAAAAQQQQQAQTQQQRAGQAGLKGEGAAFDPSSAANAEREDDASGKHVCRQYGMSRISSDWTIGYDGCLIT